MRKYAPFAGSSPDRLVVRRGAVLLAALLLAGAAPGADLRPMKTPASIQQVFPAKAKLRLLNVWATWCVPCVAEMPDLRAIDDAFGPEVSIAGVSLDDMIPETKPEKVGEFLDRHRIAFPNVYYTGNADELADRLDFDGEIPLTVVYDRKGKELWRHQGRLERDATIAKMRELLRRMR